MAFENKTIEEVYNLIISGLEKELHTRFRLLPKSFVRVLAKVLAAVFISLYRQQGWIFLQLFVDTATFDEVKVLGRKIRPLVQWGELVGIGQPREATQWSGTLTIKVLKKGEQLPQGTQFVSALTQKVYISSKNVDLNKNIVNIPVKCVDAGTSGNLDVGDELKTANPIPLIASSGLITDSKSASDEESAESYRSRVRQRWRIQPQGGSLADYRKWASEVTGVRQTYIYKDDETSSGVLIYVCADTDERTASHELCVEVGNTCTYDPETGEARKPMGAVLDPSYDESYTNIKSCVIKEFDVYILGVVVNEMDSFKNDVKNSIETYFLEREPYIRGLSVDNDRSDRISKNNITGLVNDIAEGLSGYFDSVILDKDSETLEEYTLGRGELAKLRKLYINGVPV